MCVCVCYIRTVVAVVNGNVRRDKKRWTTMMWSRPNVRAALPRVSAAGTHSLFYFILFYFKRSTLHAITRKGSSQKAPFFPRKLSAYVFAMSIGEPGWGAAAFDVGLGAITGGPPGLTMVGGIAGLTKRSDVRLLDGATTCPCFSKQAFANEWIIVLCDDASNARY